MEHKLDLVDAQLAFAALAALPGPGAKGGAEALIEISTRSSGVAFVSDLSAVEVLVSVSSESCGAGQGWPVSRLVLSLE